MWAIDEASSVERKYWVKASQETRTPDKVHHRTGLGLAVFALVSNTLCVRLVQPEYIRRQIDSTDGWMCRVRSHTPQCRVKLVLTETPDIIFTDLHSSLGKKKKKKPQRGRGGKSPATIYIISVRWPAASTVRQSRGKVRRPMGPVTKHRPSLPGSDF